eukprot:4273319-Prymnesium_polylepis.1
MHDTARQEQGGGLETRFRSPNSNRPPEGTLSRAPRRTVCADAVPQNFDASVSIRAEPSAYPLPLHLRRRLPWSPRAATKTRTTFSHAASTSLAQGPAALQGRFRRAHARAEHGLGARSTRIHPEHLRAARGRPASAPRPAFAASERMPASVGVAGGPRRSTASPNDRPRWAAARTEHARNSCSVPSDRRAVNRALCLRARGSGLAGARAVGPSGRTSRVFWRRRSEGSAVRLCSCFFCDGSRVARLCVRSHGVRQMCTRYSECVARAGRSALSASVNVASYAMITTCGAPHYDSLSMLIFPSEGHERPVNEPISNL